MRNEILDPTGLGDRAQARAGLSLAERPAELQGLTVGLLENGKQNARLFLEQLGDVLRERYGVSTAEVHKKQGFADPAPPEQRAELERRYDAVVAGVGDCGSCSAAAVADGVLFEREGTPAAVICTEAFVATADAMAEVQGAPGYSYVTVPHPVAGLTPEQVRARAEGVADRVAGLLMGERARAAA